MMGVKSRTDVLQPKSYDFPLKMHENGFGNVLSSLSLRHTN